MLAILIRQDSHQGIAASGILSDHCVQPTQGNSKQRTEAHTPKVALTEMISAMTGKDIATVPAAKDRVYVAPW